MILPQFHRTKNDASERDDNKTEKSSITQKWENPS